MEVTTVVPEKKEELIGNTTVVPKKKEVLIGNTTAVPEKKEELMGLTPVALVIIVVLSVLVVILLCIVIGIFLTKNKALSVEETVEENHYYDESVVYKNENLRSNVVDKNDYYEE